MRVSKVRLVLKTQQKAIRCCAARLRTAHLGKSRLTRRFSNFISILIIVLALLGVVAAFCSVKTEWEYYGGDSGGTKFSTLTQINRLNVSRLVPVWTFRTKEPLDISKSLTARDAFECTPLVVDGIMYLSTPSNRVVALDAETGHKLWEFRPAIDPTGGHKYGRHRGVAYWRGSQNESRIIFGTVDGRLVALNAKDGVPVETFGDHGIVNLRNGVADKWPKAIYSVKSPPAIYKNLIIAGAEVPESPSQGPSGAVRAWDVRTGKLVWRFDFVPSPGQAGAETWAPGSTVDRTGANVWSIMSVDESRGIVYLPAASASDNFFGGDRLGQNLLTDSLVAVNALTGKELWHFQMVHHDLWDYDLPAQPILATIRHGGADTPAVVQVTKMGLVFILNRVTGQPIFPIEERVTPVTDVPTEQSWPTQPFPTKPPPLSRQTIQREELNHVTPELEDYCKAFFEDLRTRGAYTPFGVEPTLQFPGTTGGGSWAGGSFDPRTSTLYVNSNELGAVGVMHEVNEGGTAKYVRDPVNGTYRFAYKELIPCQEPPWGVLTAINLVDGKIVWRVPLGGIEELELKGILHTGSPNLGGSIVTAGGLVFVGATTDRRFRAFDSHTGVELWSAPLEAAAYATPMTYLGKHTHRQYVAIAAGGGGYFPGPVSDTLVVFALPEVTKPH